MTTCDICGTSTKYIGSHALREHTPMTASPDAIRAILYAAKYGQCETGCDRCDPAEADRTNAVWDTWTAEDIERSMHDDSLNAFREAHTR